MLIIVVGAVVAIINPRFLSPINIANTANLVGLFGIFSIGQGFVIITGGIELSVGSIIALLGVIFVDLIANHGVAWPIAVLVVLGIGMLMGMAHGLLITKLHLQPFVVTLCGLLIYRGIARFYTADATAGFEFGASFPDLEWLTTGRTDIVSLITGGAAQSIPIPHAFFIMLVIAAVMWVVLHRSVFGRYLYAVGKNEEAARYSGIRTTRVIVAAYVICDVLAALSAIFFAMYTRSILPSGHGNFYELYAIAAAVLGGFSLRGGEGSIVGVVLGTHPAPGAPEPRQPARHPVVAQLRGDGLGDPDRRHRRPAVRPVPEAARDHAPASGGEPRDGRTGGVSEICYGRVRDLVAVGDREYSAHVLTKLIQIGILIRMTSSTRLGKAVVVEDYPDRSCGTSVLVLQHDEIGAPIHFLWGIPKATAPCGSGHGLSARSVEVGRKLRRRMTEMTRKSVERIYEGKYVAEVSIDLVEGDTAWAPYVSEQDVLKLDSVRLAFRRGDLAAAAREASVFELLPVSA